MSTPEQPLRPGRGSTGCDGERSKRILGGIARGSVFLVLTRIGARLGSIAFLTLLARLSGPEILGQFSYHLALAMTLYTFIEFGQSTLVTRNLSRSDDPNVAEGALAVLATTAVSCLLLGAVFVWVVPLAPAHVLLMWAAMILDAFTALSLTAARRDGRLHVIAISESLRFWGPAAAFLTLLSVGPLRVADAALPFLSLLIASGLSVCYTAFTEREHLRRHIFRARNGLSGCLREGAVIFLVNLAVGFNHRLDLIMLGVLDRPAAVAVYATAFAFVNGLLILPIVFSYVAFPELARLKSLAHDEQERTLRRMTRMLGGLGALASLGLTTSCALLISMLYGPEYAAGANVLYVVAVALPFVYVGNLLWNLLLSHGRQSSILKYMCVASVANIGLNLTLIPRFSVIGAAASTLAVEILICVLAAGSLRLSGLSVMPRHFVLVLGVCGGLPTLVFVTLQGVAGPIAATSLASLASVGSLVMTGLISRADLLRLRRLVVQRA